MHELTGAYASLTVSTSICMTIFTVGVSLGYRSPKAIFNWVTGNIFALLILAPFLLHLLDGFAPQRTVGRSLVQGTV